MDKQDNAGHMEFSCLNSKNKKQKKKKKKKKTKKKKKKKKKNIACVLYKHVHVLYMYIVHLCSFLVCINRNKYMKFHDICVGFKIYDFEIARDSEYVPEIELYRHDCCSKGWAHYSHVLRCT